MMTDARMTICKDRKNKGIIEEGHKRKIDDEQEYEVHLQTERERRKKMKDRFNELHDLIPNIPSKAGKSTIVEEATEYIKKLEETLKNLEEKKERKVQSMQSDITLQSKATSQSREEFIANHVSSNSCSNVSLPSLPYPATFHTWTSSNITLSVCGNSAHLSICSPRKPRAFTSLCFILEKYGIEVMTSSLFACADKLLFNLLLASQSSGSSGNQSPMEEMYKQATEEIIMWVTS
ncbi:hypothetical protein MLD38_023328 [Melastoma candidum]|uniref:Uncharacterized protein n=1 Tax=Melastoma candidum TaxID=119954 RepID=A0ACB9QR37_9MYRT|nr:hypothetical protein MLD38_023328 [Melastoma candidum]